MKHGKMTVDQLVDYIVASANEDVASTLGTQIMDLLHPHSMEVCEIGLAYGLAMVMSQASKDWPKWLIGAVVTRAATRLSEGKLG